MPAGPSALVRELLTMSWRGAPFVDWRVASAALVELLPTGGGAARPDEERVTDGGRR